MIKDMTEGNPLRLIVLFSIPILIGNIFQQMYQLADIFIVGRLLGENALAAVGASAPVYFMFLIIAFSFTGGLTAITAQRFGAGDFDGVRRSVTHSIRASVVLSLLLTFILVCFLHPVMHALNVPEVIYFDSYRFIFILGLAMPMLVMFNLFSGFIRALGDSKSPLYFLIFSSLLNILFNFILIKYCGLGVIGSAVGTMIAIAVSVVCCLFYIRRYFPILRIKKEDWVYDAAFMREHLNIAIPMSIQFSILSVSIMVIQAVCNSFGPQVIVGLTIALRIEQLATQPLLALGLSMATFVAQNFGARKILRIKEGVWKCSTLSFCISVVLSLFMFSFGKHIIGGFLNNPDEMAINIGVSYLSVSMMFYFFLGMIFIFKNTLQSMGQPLYPVISGFVELGIRCFAAIYLASEIGYRGIYYASPLAWLGGATVVGLGYYRYIYRFKQVLAMVSGK